MSWDCTKTRENLDDYRISNLEDGEAELFEEHVRACGACAAYVDILEKAQRGVERARMDPLLQRRLSVAVSRRPGRRAKGAHGSRRPLIAAAGAFAIAASVAAIALLPEDLPETERASAADRRWDAPASTAIGDPPTPAAKIESGVSPDGRPVFEPAAGVGVWPSKKAIVRVEATAHEVSIALEEGAVAVVIGEHVAGLVVSVTVPSAARVVATGTVFVVEVSSRGETARVLEGTVSISIPAARGDEPLALEAGEVLALDANTPAVATADEATLASDRRLAFGGDTPGVAPREERAGRVRAAKGTDAIEDRLSLASAAIEAGRLEEARALVDEIAAARPADAQTRNLLSRLARAYRHARLFQPAARTYRRLIEDFPGSESAANGLVALGQIEMDALGRPRDALAHFHDYLEEAPTGVLSEAARGGIVRAQFALGRYEDTVTAADRYRINHPGGAGAAMVERLRAESLAKLGRHAAFEDGR